MGAVKNGTPGTVQNRTNESCRNIKMVQMKVVETLTDISRDSLLCILKLDYSLRSYYLVDVTKGKEYSRLNRDLWFNGFSSSFLSYSDGGISLKIFINIPL